MVLLEQCNRHCITVFLPNVASSGLTIGSAGAGCWSCKYVLVGSFIAPDEYIFARHLETTTSEIASTRFILDAKSK